MQANTPDSVGTHARRHARRGALSVAILPVLVVISVFALLSQDAPAQRWAKPPGIGYVYPGGGQQGTTVRMLVGGQNLRDIEGVRISGDGVSAEVVKTYEPLRNINGDKRRLLQLLMKQRRAELGGPELTEKDQEKLKELTSPPKAEDGKKLTEKEKERIKRMRELPDHPLLENIEEASLKQLAHVMNTLVHDRYKQQPNTQIAESLAIEVKISRHAKPGMRELRLQAKRGFSNPLWIHVGELPEISEQEPNDPHPGPQLNLPPNPPVPLPVVINGQIEPGGVDRFQFEAKKGQTIAMTAQARRLIPYLADAVPGWFQAVLAVYDSDGRQIAFTDDYRFHPDPVLTTKIPADGVYEVEIRDSIFRGREDFVYRLFLAPHERLLPMPVENEFSWEGTSLEQEPNNAPEEAQELQPPIDIRAAIHQPGDVDLFKFMVRRKMDVIIEVQARRFGSAMDSLVRVLDADGSVIAWNDDYMVKSGHLHFGPGRMTHHADSYLITTLPKAGVYYVEVKDAQQQGDASCLYRLRLSEPRPDFELCVGPSAVDITRSGLGLMKAYVRRIDGFDGPVRIDLMSAPEGFELGGGIIPRGQDSVTLTLTTSREWDGSPMELFVKGEATIGGETITHAAVPVDDTMQAFLWRHLVPVSRLIIARNGNQGRAEVEVAMTEPVKIPAGGKSHVEVAVRSARNGLQENLYDFALSEAPEGVSLGDVRLTGDRKGVLFELKAADDMPDPAPAGNLIVEVFVNRPVFKDGEEVPGKTRRISLGVLPAIPYRVEL